jgi:hypothetical protein
MPRVEFEPTIPVSERAETFHALDRAVTAICLIYILHHILLRRPTHGG